MLAVAAAFLQLTGPSSGPLPSGPLPGPLDGAWLQPCETGALRLEVISNGRAALTEANYNDLACTKPRIAVTSVGTITLSPGATPEAINEGQIDFVFDSVQMTILDPQFIERFNSRSICGFSDWSLNAPKEIAGLSCDLFQTGHPVSIPKAGDTRYGIFSRSSASGQDTLFFGQLTPEQNGETPETRPTRLDPRGYGRQKTAIN